MLALVGLDQFRWGNDAGGDPAKEAPQALADAEHAAELAPTNVLALQAVSAVQFHLGRFDEAERTMREAVAINPYNPETLALLGIRIALRGGWREGLQYLDRSIDRMAAAPAGTHMVKGMALYVLGDYAAALPEAQAGRTCCAGFGPAVLAAVEVQRGDAEVAREALREAIARSPLLARDPRAFYALFQVDGKAIDLFVAGLEKAGLNTAAVRAAAGSAEKLQSPG
jgi:tetratricopeptide (TPR) repeat protein